MLTRGLRGVRVVLSAVFIALVLTTGSGGAAVLSAPAAALVIALAVLNVAANGLLAVRPSSRPEPTWRAAAQLAVDAALALIATVIMDPPASPLAWVALLIPVLDARAAFGPALAGIVWLALGLAYVALRMRMRMPRPTLTQGVGAPPPGLWNPEGRPRRNALIAGFLTNASGCVTGDSGALPWSR